MQTGLDRFWQRLTANAPPRITIAISQNEEQVGDDEYGPTIRISGVKVARGRLLPADTEPQRYGTGTESIECGLYVHVGGPPLSPQ